MAIIIVVTPLFNWLNSKSHFGRRTRYDIGVLVFGVFWEGTAHTPTSGRTLFDAHSFPWSGFECISAKSNKRQRNENRFTNSDGFLHASIIVESGNTITPKSYYAGSGEDAFNGRSSHGLFAAGIGKRSFRRADPRIPQRIGPRPLEAVGKCSSRQMRVTSFKSIIRFNVAELFPNANDTKSQAPKNFND